MRQLSGTLTAFICRRVEAIISTPPLKGHFKIEHIRTFSLLILTSIVLVMFWHYRSHYLRMQSRQSSLGVEERDTVNAIEKANNRADQLVKNAALVQSELERVQRGLISLDKVRDALSLKMIREDDLVNLERNFAVLAERCGLAISALGKNKGKSSKDAGAVPFTKMVYSLEAYGSFSEAVMFLSLIEQSPWSLAVQKSEMREAKGDEKAGKFSVEMALIMPDKKLAPLVKPLAELGSGVKSVRVRDLFPPRETTEKKTVKEKKKIDFGALHLTGILGDTAERYAVISNQLLRSGDTINGASVVKITQSSVVLEKEGASKELHFEAPDADKGESK